MKIKVFKRTVAVISAILILITQFTLSSCESNSSSGSEVVSKPSESHDSTSTEQYDRDESLIEEEDNQHGFLLVRDISDRQINVNNEQDAIEVLSGLGAYFDDPELTAHIRLEETSQTLDSTYYLYECLYDGIPIWGESIILAADDGNKAGLLTGKYKRASSVSSDDRLTKELAEQALLNRIAESADGSESTLEISVDVQSPSDGTRVFYPITTDELVLAHALLSTVRNGESTISVELVFSAYDGTVLDGRSLTSDLQEPTEVYNGTGSITVNGIFDTEYRTYILFDQERNIQIFNGQKGYSDRSSSDGHTKYIVPLTSDNEYFGDTEYEQAQEYEKGIQLLQIMQRLYDTYYLRFGETLGSKVKYGIYNDGYANGENMSGGTFTVNLGSGINDDGTPHFEDDSHLALYVGYQKSLNHIENIGHEYGHMIQEAHSVCRALYGEGGAICEGTADIFGILFKCIETGEEPTWVMPSSPNRDLSRQDYPGGILGGFVDWLDELLSKIPGKDRNSSTYAHLASTIFSHTAYLMWQGNDKSNIQAIHDANTQLELWYRSILLMGNVKSFADGRAAVEGAAAQMLRMGKLTRKQYNCVCWAFDEAGIGICRANVFSGSFTPGKVEVDVRNAIGGHAVDYTLTVAAENGKVLQEIRQDTVGTVTLNLREGVYVLTVRDNKGIYSDAHAYVSVMRGVWAPTEKLQIQTTFGTNIQGRIIDSDGIALDGATVRLYDQKLNIPDGWERMAMEGQSEDGGYFYLNVSPGVYRLIIEKAGYVTSATTYVGVHTGNNNLEDVTLAANKNDSLYAEIIRNAEEKNGSFQIMDLGWCWFPSGVNYLNLTDLDGDGNAELLLGYYTPSLGYYYDMKLDVWTARDGTAYHLGTTGIFMNGVDGVCICLDTWNGKKAIISGSSRNGYSAWTYDGLQLQEEKTGENQFYWLQKDMTGELELFQQMNNGGYTEGSIFHDTREDFMRKLYDELCSVKRTINMDTGEFPGRP